MSILNYAKCDCCRKEGQIRHTDNNRIRLEEGWRELVFHRGYYNSLRFVPDDKKQDQVWHFCDKCAEEIHLTIICALDKKKKKKGAYPTNVC